MYKLTAEHLEKTLFTTSKPDEMPHRGVVVIDRKHAITYQHGSSHSLLKEGQTLTLYNVWDPTLEIEVAVSFVSEQFDFIIFESINGEFPYYPHGFYSIYVDDVYRQLGVGQNRQPLWKDGIVSKRCGGAIYLGSSDEEYVDSGSVIFGLNGRIIGIAVPKNTKITSNLTIVDEADNKTNKTKMLNADVFFPYYVCIDDPDSHLYEPTDMDNAPGMQ